MNQRRNVHGGAALVASLRYPSHQTPRESATLSPSEDLPLLWLVQILPSAQDDWI